MLLGSALSACDPDLRVNLLNHVVLTGGGSLLAGFADRLNFELGRQFGNVRSTHSPLVRFCLSVSR